MVVKVRIEYGLSDSIGMCIAIETIENETVLIPPRGFVLFDILGYNVLEYNLCINVFGMFPSFGVIE